MKKSLLIAFLVSIIFQTACSSASSPDEQGTLLPSESLYETANFSIIIPKDWEIIEKNKFAGNVPEDIIVGFRNNIKSEIFTASLNISVNFFTVEMPVEEFGKNVILKTKANLLSYQENKVEIRKTLKGEEEISAYFADFQGKKEPQSPTVRFKQLFVTDKEIGYIITVAHLPDEDESVVNLLEKMLKSFSLK